MVQGWNSLPPEIRLMILRLLPDTGPGWAAHASVCSQWQAEIENQNFRQLKVRSSRLGELEDMVRHRRPLVKHIWLGIELPSSSPRASFLYSQDNADNRAFKAAIEQLFEILSRWDVGGELALELSAAEPSNDRRVPGSFAHRNEGDVGDALWGRRQSQFIDVPELRIYSGYRDGCKGLGIASLPPVHAVTRFVVRQQCHRLFRPRILRGLVRKLPRLEFLVHGLWKGLGFMQNAQFFSDYYMASLLKNHLPESIKTVSVFEDKAEAYPPWGFHRHVSFSKSQRLIRITWEFSVISIHLEHLSVAFMIEAENFFAACQPLVHVWYRLETLALTSETLTSDALSDDDGLARISHLLQYAARTALSMPKLRSLVLWNGTAGEVCKFSYDRKSASITWEGTWDVPLEDTVIAHWEKVVQKHRNGRESLSVRERRISAEVDSHFHAIELLQLPARVIDPISLSSMKREMGLTRTL
ncbi:hypothetical protein CMUS01_12735 [Colletotrichum musicola]|uniref:DUF6546 domain-containing protein n=1 Tax=Colletotrichum musicola TaxID=2175873 RepID=A0A8H6MZH0_9PEZI|nr:hypothetical protein CMUS01_12735 [Colletotrichum musicola]